MEVVPTVATGADQANQHMVDRLIAEGSLWSEQVIAAFRATPRHLFLDRVFQFHRRQGCWREIITRDPTGDELRLLYSDRALVTRLSSADLRLGKPISSSSQPSLMAQMLQDLQIKPGMRVLDIGTGTGYNAALLAYLTRGQPVHSLDVDREVLSEAWDHLRRFPDRAVQLHHADGRSGWPDAAPYDRIMATAGTPDLEPSWLEQLSADGMLLVPLDLAPGLSFILCGTVHDGIFHGRLTRAAYFMSLRAECSVDDIEDPTVLPLGDLKSVPAPWADWFGRRRTRSGWFGFVLGLSFLGFLRGYEIFYQTMSSGETCFGLLRDSACCWLGETTLLVNGQQAEQMARQLLREFLDAGGPRPTEYSLTAIPGVHAPAGGARGIIKQGPRCTHIWDWRTPEYRNGHREA